MQIIGGNVMNTKDILMDATFWSSLFEHIPWMVCVCLVIIYWLMKQNRQLLEKTFESVANTTRLTNLLEQLIKGIKND